MLNRNDYRKYWVKKPSYDNLCNGCDIRQQHVCCKVSGVKGFRCIEVDEEGNIIKYAVFKLIKK